MIIFELPVGKARKKKSSYENNWTTNADTQLAFYQKVIGQLLGSVTILWILVEGRCSEKYTLYTH